MTDAEGRITKWKATAEICTEINLFPTKTLSTVNAEGSVSST